MIYQWTDSDADHYVSACVALGIVDHGVLLHVWANESNLDPSAHNPNGNASGLFQLMPATARGLGWTLDTDLAAFRAMSVTDQLAWAVKFYGSYRGHIGTIAGAYLATFLPARLHVAGDPSAVVCSDSPTDPYAWAYRDNRSFDHAGKGAIVVQDLVDATTRAWGPRAQSIAALVSRHVDTQPDLGPALAPSDLGAAGSDTLPDHDDGGPLPAA